MSGYEKYNGFCMEFTNKEISDFLFMRFKDFKNINIKFYDMDENQIKLDSQDKIVTMCFDDNQNIAIRFLGCETSIFALDEQVMLIDESNKGTYTSSDTQYNVIYEGKLRTLEHSDLLKLIGDITECLLGALEIEMIETEAPEGKYKKYNYFKPHCYTLNVSNEHVNRHCREFENIKINY